jgi:glucose 1-dehydrogenase
MRAMTVIPGRKQSAGVGEVAEPDESEGAVLVDGLLVGICRTDVEIVTEGFGAAPDGPSTDGRLVLGHESLGRVAEAPPGSGFTAGDLVAGIVRRPDPEPCPACARGEWDYCRNGRYTERGIKDAHGYGAQRWRVDPFFAVKVPAELGRLGVLTEPASVVAKAWDQVDRVTSGGWFEPEHVLVTGAGPIGLLAALIATQRGYTVHVLDRFTSGPKPRQVAGLGGYYLTDLADLKVVPDVIIEATGAGRLVFECAELLGPRGVLCLTGISSGTAPIDVPADALSRQLVMENSVIVGSVNAAKRHYADAVETLAAADRGWLEQLVTRTVPISDWTSALDKTPDDIKVVVDLQD